VVYKYNYKPENVRMEFGGRSHSTLMPTHSSKSAEFQQPAGIVPKSQQPMALEIKRIFCHLRHRLKLIVERSI
jgi:hypothetical protein